MKPIHIKLSLFVLLIAPTLSAVPNGTMQEQRRLNLARMESMSIQEFKNYIETTPLPEMAMPELIEFFIDSVDLEKKTIKDLREKIIFLAGKTIKSLKKGEGGGLLVWAYKKNDKQMIQQLRTLGYRLDDALLRANRKLIPKLLADGAHINASDADGNTLLIKFVSALASNLRDAKWGERYKKGAYAKAVARLQPDFEFVSYLLNKGANPTIKNKQGDSALSIAKYDGGITELISLFEKSKPTKTSGRLPKPKKIAMPRSSSKSVK